MKDRVRGDSGSAPDVPEEPGPEPPSPRGGGEWGLDGTLIHYVLFDYVVPVMLLFVLLWKYAKATFAIAPLITMSEVSQRINEVIKNIILQVFDVLSPILTSLGIAQIVVGLLLGVGLRQEFLGYRLVVSGALTLIFIHIVVPLLLQFL
jgi:hypothetical protein